QHHHRLSATNPGVELKSSVHHFCQTIIFIFFIIMHGFNNPIGEDQKTVARLEVYFGNFNIIFMSKQRADAVPAGIMEIPDFHAIPFYQQRWNMPCPYPSDRCLLRIEYRIEQGAEFSRVSWKT